MFFTTIAFLNIGLCQSVFAEVSKIIPNSGSRLIISVLDENSEETSFYSCEKVTLVCDPDPITGRSYSANDLEFAFNSFIQDFEKKVDSNRSKVLKGSCLAGAGTFGLALVGVPILTVPTVIGGILVIIGGCIVGSLGGYNIDIIYDDYIRDVSELIFESPVRGSDVHFPGHYDTLERLLREFLGHSY